MQPESMRELQQRATHLGQLASGLANATPQRSEGSDATGRVIVVLAHDGLPVELRVRDGWQHRLEPEQLGSAVMEAHHDAVRQATRAFAERLDDGDWWRQRDADEPFPGEPIPPDAARPPLPGRAHNDVEYGEHILKALQNAQRQVDEHPRSLQGADDGRHVVVRLGAGGLTSCEIEPRWARDRSSATITTALAAALERAKRTAAAPGDEHRGDLDALLSDALATLASFTDQYMTRGGER
ncbi:YbaB/EbfC family nucleoid-associated protein [Actinoplanes awajinensis]|uniref:YbaB/EbfC DNA-binding family protein n=1 Tax=Actinoplanes awajinensis subsp. mycoplanecinus TaxID=135947 RepID=A0A101JJA6_9ACTN|nr:YbaB/EbfC family nucleoid-associated protein [Actinoplanes awajinensis]KUL27783.1 hypothetical protein ADL15_33630 [Actinoplanes awajinensis subsp. mycoplanecinus]